MTPSYRKAAHKMLFKLIPKFKRMFVYLLVWWKKRQGIYIY